MQIRVPKNGVLILGSISLLLSEWAWAGTIEGRISRGNSDVADAVVSVEVVSAPLQLPKEWARVKTVDQRGLRFVPHVLPILVGTEVEFPNNDPVAHNVFSVSECKRFNFGLYPPGAKRTVRFDRPGVVELLCNVHQEMDGYIVVLESPYFALTASDGTYRIMGVPAGRHRIRCWHEQMPAQEQQVDVPAEGAVKVDFQIGLISKRGRAGK